VKEEEMYSKSDFLQIPLAKEKDERKFEKLKKGRLMFVSSGMEKGAILRPLSRQS